MSNSGKGDSPRNIFSQKFKENYELIRWGNQKAKKKLKNKKGKSGR
jgi:hypothetical protein